MKEQGRRLLVNGEPTDYVLTDSAVVLVPLTDGEKLRENVEIRMPAGTAQMADPWTLLDVPGIKAWNLSAGFGTCDYLTLTGTTKAVMRAARAAGATETDLMEALLDD